VERIAVDSGSTDGTVEKLRGRGFAVRSIPQAEFNHGATRDLGISLAKGEIVVLLTQDAVPADEAWLRRLLEPYEDPRVAGVYSRQIPRPDCNPILAQRIRNWSAGKTEPVVQEVEGETALLALPPLERLARCAFDNVASSVRRRVWERIPFGRRDFGEDVAWGKRVLLAGHRIVFQPSSAVVHSHNRSTSAEFRRLYCDHQNLRELFGLRLIPSARGLLASIRRRRRDLLAALEGLPLDERRRWRTWAKRYAVAELLGIHLGARSRDWLANGSWFRPVDRWIKSGI
jgi:rhamnosyltransferase